MEDFCELVSNLPEDRRRLIEQMALHLLEAEGETNAADSPKETDSTEGTTSPLAQLHEKIDELAAENGLADSPRESRIVIVTLEQLTKFLAVDRS